MIKTVILADNQYITKQGWRFVLNRYSETAIEEALSKKDLIRLLTETTDAFVILDYTLFDFKSVEELQILESRFKDVKWLLVSDELSYEFLNTLVHTTHSFSVLLKDSSKEEIDLTFSNLFKGYRYICTSVNNILLDNNLNNKSEKEVLTNTEKEILKDIAHGYTTKEIASKRNVSSHTIVTHRKNIFRKISVNTIFEATKYAMRSGIVDIAEYTI